MIGRILRFRGPVAMLSGGLASRASRSPSLLITRCSWSHTFCAFCCSPRSLLFTDGAIATPARIVGAGVALGFAGAVKIWAIAIVVAAVIVCGSRSKKEFSGLVVGVGLGFVVPCAVFLVAAPSNFVKEVIIAQLSRGTSGVLSLSLGQRLLEITGLSGIPALSATSAATRVRSRLALAHSLRWCSFWIGAD